ncbi:MAG: hypothetical protein GY757_61865 [bacterium]|nr:hypothetical protein [bacterium]
MYQQFESVLCLRRPFGVFRGVYEKEILNFDAASVIGKEYGEAYCKTHGIARSARGIRHQR